MELTARRREGFAAIVAFLRALLRVHAAQNAGAQCAGDCRHVARHTSADSVRQRRRRLKRQCMGADVQWAWASQANAMASTA